MKQIRKLLSVLLAAVMLVATLTFSPLASAAQTDNLTVRVTSNYFPSTAAGYTNLTQYEDKNGDVYITLEFKQAALGKKIVAVDIDELTWDPSVLEWKESYNMYGSGRMKVLNIFPFAAENYGGPGMYNHIDAGRLVANYSSVSPAMWGYNEDNSGVTIVKAVFKVLDRSAGSTVVRCSMDTIAFCDETIAEPYPQYSSIEDLKIIPEGYAMSTYSTDITPASQKAVPEILLGDANLDGVVNVRDVTAIQRYLAEFEALSADAKLAADVTRDGKVTVADATRIQLYLNETVNEL